MENKIRKWLIWGPTTMRRLALLPLDVTSLHLTLQQLFKWVFLLGLLFLIPYDSQAGVPHRLCSFPVYPGTFPWSLRSDSLLAEATTLRCSRSSVTLLSSSTEDSICVCHFPSFLDRASQSPEGRFYPPVSLDIVRIALHTPSSAQLGLGRMQQEEVLPCLHGNSRP